jgi:E3 ubiquitin-protein ligase MARCH6
MYPFYKSLLIIVLLGRRVFVSIFGSTTKMHDVYAYGLGLYSLIAIILVTEFIADKTNLFLHQERDIFNRHLKVGAIRLAKWGYLLVVGGIILPLLCGACLDLYVMMPFKRLLSPGSKAEMQLLQDWAFGVIHLKIAGRIILYLDGRLAQNMRSVSFPNDKN